MTTGHRQQLATGENLPPNVKGDKLPQIIQLVFGETFFDCYGNLVLDNGFNSSSILKDIHGKQGNCFFFSNVLQ